MRINGGILRGRNIRAPKSGVRPTQDRVRGALFSILGETIFGARFLDLFAGSGAVGLEAWSRGAAFVCFVESDRRVLYVLKQNIHDFCGERTAVIGADARDYLRKRDEEAYDIIFADPPYTGGRKAAESEQKSGKSWRENLLNMIQASGILKAGGLFILEGRDIDFKGDSSCFTDIQRSEWELIDERTYGDTKLAFFRKL